MAAQGSPKPWVGVRIPRGMPKKWKCGRVRFIAPVLKTDDPKGSVSSNLTASTKIARIVKWYNGRLISDYFKFNSWSEHHYKEKTKWGGRSFTHACSFDLLYWQKFKIGEWYGKWQIRQRSQTFGGVVKWYHSRLLICQFRVRVPAPLPYKNILVRA